MSDAARPDPAIEPLGETALLLRFGSGLDPKVNARVHAAASALRAAQLPGFVDIAPAYATLALHYEPVAWPHPVWGHGERVAYTASARDARIAALRDALIPRA